VEVNSAVALPAQEIQAIADVFHKALSRQVEIKNEIHPALVGGFIAHAGNYVLNNSLLNRLVELKEEMGG
jgi:F0F1-type ATP synthase delta subunit